MHHPRHRKTSTLKQRLTGAALLLTVLAMSAAAAVFGPEVPMLPTILLTVTGGIPIVLWAVGWLLVVTPLLAAAMLLLLGTPRLRRYAIGALVVSLPLLILLGKPRGQPAEQWRTGELAPFAAAVEATSLALLLLTGVAALIFVVRLALGRDLAQMVMQRSD